MKDLSRAGFSHQEVMAALTAESGTRQVRFHYDLIREGATVCQLPVLQGSVRCRKEDSIRRTARFTMADDPRINWLTDRIRPVMMVRMADAMSEGGAALRSWSDLGNFMWKDVNYTWGELASGTATTAAIKERWISFPLGVFIPSTPKKKRNIITSVEVESYDLSVILKEDSITERLFFAAGTNYLEAVESILISAGIEQIRIAPSSAVMSTDHEYEIGAQKLDIVNSLLEEISYDRFSVDENGVGVLRPFVEPSADQTTIEYGADGMSVLSDETQAELDLYSVPNVFIATVSNPDYTKSNKEYSFFRAEYVNDDPASPLSTVRRGRKIVQKFSPNDIASQEDLEKYVRRQAYLAGQIYETVQISTALMPIHTDTEIPWLDHPAAAGAYEEIGWEMPLSAGGKMTHEARKVMIV